MNIIVSAEAIYSAFESSVVSIWVRPAARELSSHFANFLRPNDNQIPAFAIHSLSFRQTQFSST